MNEAPSADQEWERFGADLAICLGDLMEDEFLVLTHKRGDYYVQFAGQGQFGMRVEAVSNFYLDENGQMVADDYVRMYQLGWQLPTARFPESGGTDPDGSPNFFADFSSPVDFHAVSQLAVRTLLRIYRIGHPGNLQYKCFSRSGVKIRFPTLRIMRVE